MSLDPSLGSPSRVRCDNCNAVIDRPCRTDGRSWFYCPERIERLRLLLQIEEAQGLAR